MKRLASKRFWTNYHSLLEEVRRTADRAYALLKLDPRHPSLHLKKIGRLWSVRVGLHHRALGVEFDADMVWFWIGPTLSMTGSSPPGESAR